MAKTVRQRVVFRREDFDARIEPLGHESVTDKARFVGVKDSTFHRVYFGTRSPGGVFIQGVLRAPWPEPVRFEDFFGDEAA